MLSLFCLPSLAPGSKSKCKCVVFTFTLHFILLVGNIESNPGPHELSQSILENNHTDRCISLCNINIRSIRNKMEFLGTSLNDFDILVVTETRLDNQINDSDITLDSFPNIIHRKDRANSGGGLLIYSKNDISISRKSELENNLDETIWVEIRSKGQSFLLCNTYRSPCTDIDYWTRLTYAIELVLQVNENIIITGDLNSNLLCSNNNKLIDLVNIFNL